MKSPKLLTRYNLMAVVPLDGKGRGVVARRQIPADRLLEVAPVIPFTRADRPRRSTVLAHYPFEWKDPPYIECLPLGVVPLLNHSSTPNCWVETDVEGGVIRLRSLVAIPAGEELTHNYGVDPWFDVVG